MTTRKAACMMAMTISCISLISQNVHAQKQITKEGLAIHQSLKPRVYLKRSKRPGTTRVVITGAAVAYQDYLFGISKDPAKRTPEKWTFVTKSFHVSNEIADRFVAAATKGPPRIHSEQVGCYGRGHVTNIRLVAGSGDKDTVVLDKLFSRTQYQYGTGQHARAFSLKFPTKTKKWTSSASEVLTSDPRKGIGESRTGGAVEDPGVWLTNTAVELHDLRTKL